MQKQENHNISWLLGMTFMVILNVACGVNDFSEQPATHEGLGLSATGQEAQSAIYGIDGRQDIYRAESFWADLGVGSVAAIMSRRNFSIDDNGKVQLNVYTLQESYQTCSDVPFNDQPLASSCSATLIDEDLVLTAGHCVSRCSSMRFVFNYYQESSSDLAEMREEDVYGCSQVLVRELDNAGRDYAIVKLNRPATGQTPAYAPSAPTGLSVGDELTLIGFPNGLPMKVANDGEVAYAVVDNGISFSGYVDAFSGNSGSGVFDASGQVVGILTAGAEDFVRNGSCNSLAFYSERGYGESIQFAYQAVSDLCASGYPSPFLCNSEPSCGDGYCSNGETEANCEEDCNWLAWTCDRSYYDANDGCDCGCGVYDPDCSDPDQEVFGCVDDQICNLSGYCGEPGSDVEPVLPEEDTADDENPSDDSEEDSRESEDDEEEDVVGSYTNSSDDGDDDEASRDAPSGIASVFSCSSSSDATFFLGLMGLALLRRRRS